MAENKRYVEIKIEGRNAVLEALRSHRDVDRIVVADTDNAPGGEGKGGAVKSILSLAERAGVPVRYEKKEYLDKITETGKHQGVIAFAPNYNYAEVSDLLKSARDRGEAPFLILLDGIEDPHNLGAIIRTANLAGAHGVVIPKRRAAGLTGTVARTSAGAINYTPVARVTNMAATIEELKNEGMWFVCADMGGTTMYDLNLTGPIGLVIGNEGNGVSRLVREKCDMIASIPMKGDIDSLNASVACGVLAYEIVRQRLRKI
jgi:23S rRNA (guanosine2251-2'-O)-methyltransferase